MKGFARKPASRSGSSTTFFILGKVTATTQGELATILGIDRSTNALVIGILENKRLVERWSHSGDSRKKCVRLTEEGEKLLRVTQPLAAEAAKQLVQPISSEDLKMLLAILNKLVDGSQPKAD